jgi:hypothetical protein
MNPNDQILAEIKERWKRDLDFLECGDNLPPRLILATTHPARDIRYLLNRLEAAERAAKGLAKLLSQKKS